MFKSSAQNVKFLFFAHTFPRNAFHHFCKLLSLIQTRHATKQKNFKRRRQRVSPSFLNGSIATMKISALLMAIEEHYWLVKNLQRSGKAPAWCKHNPGKVDWFPSILHCARAGHGLNQTSQCGFAWFLAWLIGTIEIPTAHQTTSGNDTSQEWAMSTANTDFASLTDHFCLCWLLLQRYPGCPLCLPCASRSMFPTSSMLQYHNIHDDSDGAIQEGWTQVVKSIGSYIGLCSHHKIWPWQWAQGSEILFGQRVSLLWRTFLLHVQLEATLTRLLLLKCGSSARETQRRAGRVAFSPFVPIAFV